MLIFVKNYKNLAYSNFLLYLCARNCKMGNCVNIVVKIVVLRDTINRRTKTMADIEKITHIELVPEELINDLRQIIDSARSHVAATANYEVTMMNWNIGNRINRDVLNYERAEYGKQIVAQVARQLQDEYGTKGFEGRTVRRMMKFAQLFPDLQIVAPLARKLSWSHFLIVMPMKTSPESTLRSISPNCPRRKFSFANCKNPLR